MIHNRQSVNEGEDQAKSVTLERILVYCPNTGGHRHLYIKRICDLLLESAEEVFVFAIGLQLSAELKVFDSFESVYLDALRTNPRVKWITCFDPETHFRDEALFIRQLQERYRIELTLFPDGDALIPTFSDIAVTGDRPLLGRNYALFIRSEFLHEAAYQVPDLIPHSASFYQAFFGAEGICETVLDGRLVTDEQFSEFFPSGDSFFLPDIILADETTQEQYGKVPEPMRQAVNEFLDEHSGKNVLLLFGVLENRKGYDFILKYALNHADSVVLRVGRTNPLFDFNDREMANDRATLLRERRLFELELFVNEAVFIDELFEAANVMLLPYRDFFRTSALMLEAVIRGKPVLVPDVGVMAARVKDHQLGRTFRNKDYASFEHEAELLIEHGGEYREHLAVYRPNLLRSAQVKWIGQVLAHASGAGDLDGKPEKWMVPPSLNVEVDLIRMLANKRLKLEALERFVEVARSKRTVVFGAGLYAAWLELMSRNRDDLKIVAVADSQPTPGRILWQRPVVKLDSIQRSSFDVIALATEKFQKEMTRQCKECFGGNIPVADLNPTYTSE